MKKRFMDDNIEDILFVSTYSGSTPEWPAKCPVCGYKDCGRAEQVG